MVNENEHPDPRLFEPFCCSYCKECAQMVPGDKKQHQKEVHKIVPLFQPEDKKRKK